MDDDSIFLILRTVFFAYVLIRTNWFLRKENSTGIYVIWYAFSFSLILFSALQSAAEIQNYQIPQLCGSYEKTCAGIYDSLTNIDDEVIFLVVVTSLTVGPQLLAYLLSGIFGAARSPRLVRQTTRFVIWSYIKFNACLAGVLTVSGFTKLITHATGSMTDFSQAALWLSASFAYAIILSGARHRFCKYEKIHRQVGRVHKFFTRNVPET